MTNIPPKNPAARASPVSVVMTAVVSARRDDPLSLSFGAWDPKNASSTRSAATGGGIRPAAASSARRAESSARSGRVRIRSRRPALISPHIQARACAARRSPSAPLASRARPCASSAAHSSATPRPSRAEHSSTVGVHAESFGRSRCSAEVYSDAVLDATGRSSPSALLTTTRSASSTIPRLIPCSSSPPPGRDQEHEEVDHRLRPRPRTGPTPTVSTSTTSKPAASQTSIASRVRRATPPSVPPVGEGRMNASSRRGELAPSGSCRRGSTRRLRLLDGSTASTATRCPSSTTWRPSASMNVDLPAPGRAADPDPRAPRRSPGSTSLEQRVGLGPVVGPGRLDERDGPRQCPSVAGAQLRGQLGHAVAPCRDPSRIAAVGVMRSGGEAGRAPRTRPPGCCVPGPNIAATPASWRNS